VAEAGWKLKRRLSRKNPGVLIWSGVTCREPFVVLIRAAEQIEVPKTTKSDGIEYKVQFLVRE
jgi:hypothetical protein